MTDIQLPFFEEVRLESPQFLLAKLKVHPLTRSLYPIAMGHRVHSHNISQEDIRVIDGYLLIYCTEGQGQITCSGITHPVGVGNLVLIPPHASFDYQTDSDALWSFYWVNFDGDLAADFAQRLYMKMDDKIANVAVQPKVIADFETLLELEGRGYTATNVIHAVHLLQQMLSYLALQLRLHQPPNYRDFDIEDIEAFMMEHLHKDLALDRLAEHANLSKYYFSKKFKEVTGYSPIQYFINMKMQHACYLLKNQSSSIKQIGASLGYEDPYYFSRIFKKALGVSPSQYQKAHQQT